MIKRTIKQVCEMVNGSLADGIDESHRIRGVSIDSRTIALGNLFIPIIGEKADAHNYVHDALAKGAMAALWQLDHPHPPRDLPLIFVKDTLAALQQLASQYRLQLPVKVVGITGSNGKTTTKDLLAAILETTYKVYKTIGNMNTHIGLPLTLLEIDEDTEVAVLEMGMRARGEIALLSQIARPTAVIITNIGESHLEHLGTREEIARAKLEITSGLEWDGLLVYNGDEPLIEAELREMNIPKTVERLRFGAAAGNDYYPLQMANSSDPLGMSFVANVASEVEFYIPLLGKHNVINSMAAIAVAAKFGVSKPNIAAGFQQVKLTGMRIEVVHGLSGLTILNDAFNASPTSMRAAIQLLADLTGFAQKIIILGDMLELGVNDQLYHREIGRVLNPQDLDYVFTYGELARYIAEEAKEQFSPGKVRSFADKEQMLAEIKAVVTPQDLLLVKGSRGMKLEEIVEPLREYRR